jgi:divinyl chlorophyllide a 8-vinyl-reductase
VRGGKPFLLFGEGAETACKPISDEDLAAFIVTCIENEEYHDRTLPIGGPGPAITPKEQGLELFRLIGTKPRFRSVPPGMFRLAAGVLGAGGKLIPALEDKAEFARIAHYYGTESMLVWDQDRETYDEAKTPSFGSRTLFDHYCEVVEGRTKAGSLGDHAMFEKATVRRP